MVYGIPWCHGLPRYTMVYHGIPCFTIVYSGIPQYDCDVLWHCRTISWYDSVITHHSRTVVYQSKLWWSMVYHGIPCTMVYHWYTMVYIMVYHGYHGLPWCTMVHRGVPWCTMVYRGTPWYTMAYHGTTVMCYDIVIKWYTMVYTTVYHKLPWCTMVYNGIPWYTMVYYGTPWYTTLRLDVL